MRYVFEKGVSMPLCAEKNGIYFNYLNGQVIDNINVLDFIKKGLKNKSMSIVESAFKIYKVIDKGLGIIVAYNYILNGISNYVNEEKILFDNSKRQIIINNLMNGKYKQELVWGDDRE